MGDRVDAVLSHNRHRSGSIDEAIPSHAHRRRHSRQSTYSEQQLQQLDRIGSDFRLQRDLQRTLMELSAREDEYREAVEIQTRLEAENEDLLEQINQLTQQLGDQMVDIKVLQQKCNTLEELYNEEHDRFEAEIKEREDQVAALEADMFQKDAELDEMAQELETHQTQVHTNVDDVLRQQSSDLIARGGEAGSTSTKVGRGDNQLELSTDLERDLYERLMDERKKLKEATRKVDNLLVRLEKAQRLAAEYENVKRELEELKAYRNDEVMRTEQTHKAISDEIVAVATRNAALQQDFDELQQLLEDKEYQIRMLEAELEMDRTETARDPSGGFVGSLGEDIGAAIQEIREENAKILQLSVREEPRLSSGKLERLEAQRQQEQEKKEDDVPDVLKEYLHLTASAVKIKFPQVQSITSEQLIEKVQKLSFFQYHDAMVRIMKNEEAKIKQKDEDAKTQSRKRGNTHPGQGQGGMFSRIAAFFSNGTGADEAQAQARAAANRDFEEVPTVTKREHKVK